MVSVKNVISEFITNTTTTGDFLTTGTVADLTTGKIAFIDLSGNVIDPSSAITEPKFRIALGTATTPRLSDVIVLANITHKKLIDYVDDVEQISYVGYNGTSGSIEVIDNNVYQINFDLKSRLAPHTTSELKQALYKSDATATQTEIANGLIKSCVNNFSREPEKFIKFELVNAGAAANALGTATLAVTNGSKYVVFNEDMTSLVTVGTILRIGGLGAGVTPCYIVEAVNTGAGAARVYTLNIPYQGTTNAALANNLVESVTAGNWGIKMTGIPLNFVPGEVKYEKSRFELSLVDCGNTAITYATASYEGIGNYEQVAELEWFTQLFDKETTRLGVPPVKLRQLATSGINYDTTVINWYSQDTQSTIASDPKSFKQVILFTNTAGTGLYDAIESALGLAIP
jgi:hypothetical protein